MTEKGIRFQSRGWKGYAADEKWAKFFSDLDNWLAHHPGKLIVSHDCRDVRRVETSLGVVYIKDIRALTDAGMHFRDIFSWCKWVFRGSRAIETWNASQALLRRGFLCPKPVLAVRKRRGIIPRDLFISEELPLPNLWDFLPTGMTPHRLAEMLAVEIQRLHRAGFAHGDCILRNLCYDETKRSIAYLDNDRTWVPPAAVRQFQQQRNLAQMTYSLLKRFGDKISLHFLECYAKRAGWPDKKGLREIQAGAIRRKNRKRIQ